ncbi:hypothetical protein AT6N2_C1789 [Agrobacterium tumefaciens]|nr:hypothetical protein AT6N2_C1789 [Agrobacterium tumefaciens]
MHRLGQHFDIPDDARATGPDELLIGLAEILHMRAGKNGTAEHGWLQRVLPALRRQGAADKGKFGQTKVKPHFADGIAKENIGFRGDGVIPAAAGDRQVHRLQHRFHLIATLGMAWHDDGQLAVSGLDSRMHGGRRLLLAVKGRDRRPCLATTDLFSIGLQKRVIAGRRVRIALKVSRNHHRPGAEIAETFGIEIGLRHHERQLGKQRFSNIVTVVPAVEGPVRETRVHTDLRNVATLQFHHRHRPDFGLSRDGSIGCPVSQETVDGNLDIERHILVDHIVPQPGPCKFGRRHRARGEENENIALADFADQRDEGERFADTCGVEPDERSARALGAGVTETLQPAALVFLALGGTIGKIGFGEWVSGDTGNTVTGESETCDTAAHDILSLIIPRNALPLCCCYRRLLLLKLRHFLSSETKARSHFLVSQYRVLPSQAGITGRPAFTQ